MDRLNVMQLFIRVVETGSFSKAAQAMGVNQPTVSKQVAALEAHLGAQLLRRSSRGLSLTDAGQDYYESAVRILGEVDEAESRIGKGQVAPAGVVRVAISAALGRLYVVPRLPEFHAQYPEVQIDFEVSERHVNLIEDGIDLAVRIGTLTDSTLLARRIGSVESMTVAAPAYLERRGVPQTPADLEQHDCIAFIFNGSVRPWSFKGAAGQVTYVPKGPMRSNDAEYIRAAVLAGLGVAHNLSWLYANEIESGALIELLPGQAPGTFPINAVRPAGRRLPGRVKVFIEFLARIFAETPSLRSR